MSLEDKLEKLTAAVEAQTIALNEVIGLTKSGGAASSGTASDGTAAPKKTNKKATETAGAVTVPDEQKKALGSWLAEFAKEADKDNPDGAHIEVKARKAALKKAFEGLGVKSLGEITTQEQIDRLATWFEKAKAKGRLAPDPVEEDDDDMGV